MLRTAVFGSLMLVPLAASSLDPFTNYVRDKTGVPPPPAPIVKLEKSIKETISREIPGAKVADKSEERLGNDVLGIAKMTTGETIRILEREGGGLVKTVQKANGDTAKTILKGGKDVEANYRKAWKDNRKNTEQSLRDVSDAVKAVANYTKRELEAERTALRTARDQATSSGKIVDAMWTTSVSRAHSTEDNFFAATQESSIISAAAQSAAAMYGGPAGAAAYAAWATYKATGDANMALRAGLVAAVTSQMGTQVNSMPSATMGEVLKKSAMAGAAGGISVAAAGGDEKAITEGFLKSGGTVLIQGTQSRIRANSPRAAAAIDTVQCISARDVDCVSNLSYVKDQKHRLTKKLSKYDPKQYAGRWSAIDPNSPEGKKLALITQIAKLPNSQIIPLMDNKWVLTTTLGKNGTINNKTPTVVLTYVGKEKPFTFTSSYKVINVSKVVAKNKASQSRARGYQCRGPGGSRRIDVTSTKNSCNAIYYRENGSSQVVWKSVSNHSICSEKADTFVANLQKQKGISCNPR